MNCLSELKIAGILNITPDSFSDGNRYLDTTVAIEQGRRLIADGADMVDIGAESSNPDGEKIIAEQEIERLAPVIGAFKELGIACSVDTYKPKVMEYAISQGVDMINDITGLRDPAAVDVIRKADLPVVIMFARNRGPHAERTVRDHAIILEELDEFFTEQLRSLNSAGIPRERILLDPGMGLFLGGNPEPSLMVLRHIDQLKKYGCKLYLSASRKSFIGAILDRRLNERGIGTLAVEIWAWQHGVSWIRTHEPKPLRDAVRMIRAIEEIE
ncbi:MAG: dihydropteroate synthase [Chitinivibrionales bacterium]|nr:dihydropteroate synthase [Chitinivibrionales bacterium]